VACGDAASIGTKGRPPKSLRNNDGAALPRGVAIHNK